MSTEECGLCKAQFEDKEAFAKHLKEAEHIFLEEVENAVQLSSQSRINFTIDDSQDLENIILRKDTPKTLNVKLTTTSFKPVTISSIQTDSKISEIEFAPNCPHRFSSSDSISWEMKVHTKNEGIVCYHILIKTENGEKTENYAVKLVFHTHDEFYDNLHPTEPYQPLPKTDPEKNNQLQYTVDGDPPKKWQGSIPMKPYAIPHEVLLALNHNLKPFKGITQKQQTQMDDIQTLIDVDKRKSLTVRENYGKLLEILLYSEECQLVNSLKRYDLPDQFLTRSGNFLELHVPDLAERRPSIMVGDVVRLRDSTTSRLYHRGVVQIVKEQSVMLRFRPRFFDYYSEDRKFSVSFTFNRYCLRAQHQAVDFAKTDNIDHLFFETTIPKKSLDLDLEWFNKDIANNLEQQQAVRAILLKSAMPAPYLIFGPPGTGKTMTVVEAVKQIMKTTNDRVLICTPSNNAANELMRRLIDTLTPKELFRLVSLSFQYQMPQELRRYSNLRPNFYMPKMRELSQYRVVVTTLMSTARIVNGGCYEGHFSYVFVDEAGQATESETLIAVSRILSSKSKSGELFGQVVLAGDPRQLGPIVFSNFAKECGMDRSMLERLMDNCSQYQKDETGSTNPAAFVKLLKNYRSHPVILNQPNFLFYENELQVCGDDLINAAVNWEFLPNKQFPMVFHSVMGVDLREKRSPSYFNIQEIQIVMDYLGKLIGCKMNGLIVEGSHIAVISPYRKQAEKLKQAIECKRYQNVFVGSVEQIQGQEKMIVIISTVRSKHQLLNYDARFNLGFLTNPKRFNVAITRPKALLIIVGNPNVLQLDKYWKSLIVYCKENGAVTGEEFEITKEENSEIKEEESSEIKEEENSGSFSNVIASSSVINETDSGEGTSCSGTDN